MNILPLQHSASRNSVADLAVAIGSAGTAGIASPARRNHRERDFGIGYGNSSGYAGNDGYQRTPSYVNNAAQSLFRFA